MLTHGLQEMHETRLDVPGQRAKQPFKENLAIRCRRAPPMWPMGPCVKPLSWQKTVVSRAANREIDDNLDRFWDGGKATLPAAKSGRCQTSLDRGGRQPPLPSDN